MGILAIETSCDETSAAVVQDGEILANVVSSQVQLHAEYGGVVPELAAREHLRNLLPVCEEALRQAGLSRGGIEAVAATRGPGLPSALMVGFKSAQAVAYVLRRPFLGIHHHEAHLYSPWISGDPPTAEFDAFVPNISLIVSGGHTMLIHVEAELRHHLLGSTLDDAAGECFDKVGKQLGLAYPAGPIMDKLARRGDCHAYDFPRPMIQEPNDDFSFSGLKTSVRYFLRDNPQLMQEERSVCDICASVQRAIVDVLVEKTFRAAGRLGLKCITASGGVTCNSELRERLGEKCHRAGFDLRLAPPSLCTDNAGMIGILAERKLAINGELTGLDTDILPGWKITDARSGH